MTPPPDFLSMSLSPQYMTGSSEIGSYRAMGADEGVKEPAAYINGENASVEMIPGGDQRW